MRNILKSLAVVMLALSFFAVSGESNEAFAAKKKTSCLTKAVRKVKRDVKRTAKKTKRAIVKTGANVQNAVVDSAVNAKAKVTGKKKSTFVKGHYKKGQKTLTNGHFRKVSGKKR